MLADDLAQAFAGLVGAVGDFEDAVDVGRVVRQPAPLRGVRIAFEVLVIGEREILRGGNVGDRALLLAGGVEIE